MDKKHIIKDVLKNPAMRGVYPEFTEGRLAMIFPFLTAPEIYRDIFVQPVGLHNYMDYMIGIIFPKMILSRNIHRGYKGNSIYT